MNHPLKSPQVDNSVLRIFFNKLMIGIFLFLSFSAHAQTSNKKRILVVPYGRFDFVSEFSLEDIAEKNENRMPEKINMGVIKQRLDDSFESPYWDTVHLPCLKCGVCTFVCPTCYCFDITEKEFDYTCGERNRTWDTCMSEIFTRMAGGANPRLDPKRRFRQRMMHKFKYHVDNFNEELCTGCGRCIKYCPAGVDVRKVLEEVK